MVRMGPVVRATEDRPRRSPTSRHLTSPLTVPRDQRRRRSAWRSPPTRSHGGSQPATGTEPTTVPPTVPRDPRARPRPRRCALRSMVRMGPLTTAGPDHAGAPTRHPRRSGITGVLLSGSWPVTRRDPALGTKTDSEPESQRTVMSRSSTAVTTPLRVTVPTFSDSRAPGRQPRPSWPPVDDDGTRTPSVLDAAGFIQDARSWQSLWRSGR
jgi:hypothetical protein